MGKRIKAITPLQTVLWVTMIQKRVGGRLLEITGEVLECGHIQPVKSDIYGEYYCGRRRCGKCRAGAPPDISSDELVEYREAYQNKYLK